MWVDEGTELMLQRKHNVRGTDEQAGGIFEVESFIPYSNVQLLDPVSKCRLAGEGDA